ncbi:Meiosis mei2 [Hyphodiscus hymeniophilus]|uniref:Meiosis mei2 n=1 Tax=Hyphodiscus hymeniophilus TaxID=353542 RepID=A0A9P6VIG3_9HELO|nr:Meiosis mei2 [Hyphodiscus hymeniophilus]
MVYDHSPHSSSGVAGSSEGTPDTRFTAFSPEDTRPIKPSTQNGTPQRANQQDPFISTSAEPKAEQKLSATASDFKPYSSNLGHTQNLDYVSAYNTYSATAALPQAAENLRILIGQMPGRGNTGQAGPAKAAAQVTTNQFGTFSTDTSATRCFQITSIYKTDSPIHHTVFNSLEEFKKRGFKRTGSERFESSTTTVLIRFSNINDAAEVYTALKLGLPKYAVEYISPVAFASQAVNSPSKGSYSAHEGQIIVVASYPTGTPCNKKVFEEGLVDVLSVEGDLFAWQKQAASTAGTYRMVAEYCDANHAIRAVERLNGQQIKLPQGDVVLALELHTPDIQTTTHRLGNMTTPTRCSTEPSNIADTLGRLSLKSNPSFPGQQEGFTTATHSPSGLSYMASNAAYGVPPTPFPLVMSGMYGAAPPNFSHGYPAGMQFQAQMGGSDFNSFHNGFGHHNLALAQTGYDHGFGQVGFQQQNYEQNFGQPNTLFHQRGGGYFGRTSGRRHLKFTSHGPRRANGHSSSNGPGNGHYSDSDRASGQHNQVEIHRIKQGIDVRTTVMLRNIPNKIDQHTLKQIVDESSFGRYDFMYLRIDFSNDCNVGYAFINFVDPLDIIDFVIARSNQKWHMFRSDKVAEVSYATIQGRDCLIQKFRNSSVMLEPAHYRPKLFWTVHDQGIGPVGEEEEFPASDNSSKLRRSCENAEHVGTFTDISELSKIRVIINYENSDKDSPNTSLGLFAPNAGQQLRDDQRRRRSQFDRGTTLAEREEEYYEEEEDEEEMQDPRHPSYRGYMRILATHAGPITIWSSILWLSVGMLLKIKAGLRIPGN